VNIWYRVSDLEAARDFYTGTLGFEEVYLDAEDRWARLVRGGVELAIAEEAQDRGARRRRLRRSRSPTSRPRRSACGPPASRSGSSSKSPARSGS
jgi:catechol 2,3-dioxygenase-like lactoylglutathione lyase family enzyme